jgi:hypothetical protein
MTSYGLTITDAACESPVCHAAGVCPPPGFRNWSKCPRCNGDGTRTIATGRDATPLAEAVRELVELQTADMPPDDAFLANVLARDRLVAAARDLFDGLFPKEDTPDE